MTQQIAVNGRVEVNTMRFSTISSNFFFSFFLIFVAFGEL